MNKKNIIAAEEIIKDAKEHQKTIKDTVSKNKYVVMDLIQQKRKEFEQKIKQNKNKIRNYVEYAQFEERCGEIERIKNIFTRGVEENYENIFLWEKFIEYELKYGKIEEVNKIYKKMLNLHPVENLQWEKYVKFCNQNKIENLEEILYLWNEKSKSLESLNFIKKYLKKDKNRYEEKIIKIYEKNVKILDLKNLIAFYTILKKRKGEKRKEILDRIEKYKFINEHWYIEYTKFKINDKSLDLILEDGIKKFPLSLELREMYFLYLKKPFNSNLMFYILIIKETKFSLETIFNTYLKILSFSISNEEKINIFKHGFLHNKKSKEMELSIHQIIKNLKYEDFEEDIESFLNFFIFYIKEEIEEFKILKDDGDILIKFAERARHSNAFIEYSKIIYKNLGLKDCRLLLGRGIGICKSKAILKFYYNFEFSLNNYDFCRKLMEKYLEMFPECKTGWEMCKELEKKIGCENRIKYLEENSKNFDL